MLPTNEKALNTILLNPSTNKIEISKGYLAKEYQDIGYKTFYLYIISDDKIEEGDWVLTDKNVIGKVIKISNNGLGVEIKVVKNNGLEYYPLDCKKIIATTDSSLTVKDKISYGKELGKEVDVSLPQPSQSFIQKYVKEYNKGNIITDELIVYEEYAVGNYGMSDGEPTIDERLKVNPKDNTITIKKIKNSWTREEVIELIKRFNSESSGNVWFDTDEKWIEENL